MMSWTGTCSSSPPEHPHTLFLNFIFIFISPAQALINSSKNEKRYSYAVALVWCGDVEMWPFLQGCVVWHNM